MKKNKIYFKYRNKIKKGYLIMKSHSEFFGFMYFINFKHKKIDIKLWIYDSDIISKQELRKFKINQIYEK